MERTKIKELLLAKPGQKVLAKGWVRTKRGNKEIAFIALNDGSTINNIQIVVDKSKIEDSILAKVTTGACIGVTGNLVEPDGLRHPRVFPFKGVRIPEHPYHHGV